MLTEAEAIVIAKRFADVHGNEWEEPVEVKLLDSYLMYGANIRSPAWFVITNAGTRGSNLITAVDVQTGEVVWTAYICH